MVAPITGPEDLHQMSLAKLQALAKDVRQLIISTCLQNGGHIAASLGAVEIAIALHTVFSSPRDSLIWDVGHQAYAHKILTGRWGDFHTLRKLGGISGFLKREESPHDIFGAGHSSTALSAALAIAWANQQQHQSSESCPWAVAVVGDGGLTAGLSYEALNNFRSKKVGPLLILLNDNQMSISENVGAIPGILSGPQAREYFELFGVEYFGPVNGHDLEDLIKILNTIKSGPTSKPIVLHTFTVKGKGYSPAEALPVNYHGISGKSAGKSSQPAPKTYSEVFGDVLCELAAKDDRIVAITAAMPEGTGLSAFSQKFPDRFFDVGIAEAHAVTFAAGLATQGYRPVVAIYSTFLQRALDSIVHDVAIQNLGVTFAIDRAGLVGADGPTHHGAFDLAYLGMIPGMTLTAPSCLDDLSELLKQAISSGKPWALRYPRGSGASNLGVAEEEGVRFHQLAQQPRRIVVSIGAATQRVQQAVQNADPKSEGISFLSTTFVKPFSPRLLTYLQTQPKADLFIVEDGSIHGGVGQNLIAALGPGQRSFTLVGYEDHFIPHGSPSELEETQGLSVRMITERILRDYHV